MEAGQVQKSSSKRNPCKAPWASGPQARFLTAPGPPCAPWAPEALAQLEAPPHRDSLVLPVDVALEFEALDLDRFAGRAGSVALLQGVLWCPPVAGAQEDLNLSILLSWSRGTEFHSEY